MRPIRLLSLAFTCSLAGAACARSDTATTDTATTDTAAGSTASGAMDSTMDHSKMPGMAATPARDADQEFLRMMVDHHEGMVAMATTATERATSATTKEDAGKLHQKQLQERDEMLRLLKSAYSETHQPSVPADSKKMVDELKQVSAAQVNRDFYKHTVMHHEGAVKMIDQFLPRLTRAEVRTMAQRMKTDQAKEIVEFRRKS